MRVKTKFTKIVKNNIYNKFKFFKMEKTIKNTFVITLLALSIYALFIGVKAYIFNNFNDFAGATLLQIVIFFALICFKVVKNQKK